MKCLEVRRKPDFEHSPAPEGFSQLRCTRVYYVEGCDLDGLAERWSLLADPMAEEIAVDGRLEHDYDWMVEVGFKNGVTDNEARVVEEVLWPAQVRARSARRYYLKGGGFTSSQLQEWASQRWANPLIQRLQVVSPRQKLAPPPPLASVEPPATQVVPLQGDLGQLSRERLLALSVEEMTTIQQHFAQLGRDPSEVELEALAQTWSEHCKHKIFNDLIDYRENGSAPERVSGLFKTYIAGATAQCQRPWLVSVFSDNAGVIQWNPHYHLVFKVETHNAPSALEPYGGALTGIVGVNRDPAGTGLGADLIFNTDVFCFAPLDYSQPLPPGVLSPRRLYEGVRQGVEDGGNQSGIPTVNGALFFDERYLGRPLVFCGTGALMERTTRGRPGHEKSIEPGDLVVMAGGRVGKDGIHGATFSSLALEAEAPVGVVQIGDPMTQKRLLDMLKEARQAGLYRALTDNGAGGLCSSVGEMAQMSGGAELALEAVPLKYPGLAAWEILVSESQERMTLAVPPQDWPALQALAQSREVEVSHIGVFNASGRFSASFQGQPVMDLDLEFLHKGYPLRVHQAHWRTPPQEEVVLPSRWHWPQILLDLLASPNICSREGLIRQYDHEVQGSSVIKPLVGAKADGPSDAAVLRPDHASDQGVVVSCAINPHYGDIDPEGMSELLVDEAIRNAVAVGADPEHLALLDNFCWPDPVGDPHKMAQLVRCCRGLAQAVVAFQAPLISGKDSMKNDYHGPEGKLSIPPTLLVSAIANLPDCWKATSMDFKQAGDRVYLLGPEQPALGGSQVLRLLRLGGGNLGRVDFALARRLYAKVFQFQQRQWLASCHDCSEGGLLVALAESCLAGRLGLRLELPLFDLDRLFGEAPSRLVVSIDPNRQVAFESELEDQHLPWVYLGAVTTAPELVYGQEKVTLEQLLQAWQKGGPQL